MLQWSRDHLRICRCTQEAMKVLSHCWDENIALFLGTYSEMFTNCWPLKEEWEDQYCSTVQWEKEWTWKVLWVLFCVVLMLCLLLILLRVNCQNGPGAWFKGDPVLSVEVYGSRRLLSRHAWPLCLCKYIGTVIRTIKPSLNLATSSAFKNDNLKSAFYEV